jgi:hypothetical protein
MFSYTAIHVHELVESSDVSGVEHQISPFVRRVATST